MAASSKTFSSAASEAVLAADGNRDFYVLQLLSSSNPVYFAFGETAVASKGMFLRDIGDTIKVTRDKARLACNGIDAGSDAVVTIETGEEVEYRSGRFAGPWPAS